MALAAVKRGVEAGNLRDGGRRLRNGPDRRQIMRLVQRRQRDQPGKRIDHRRVDPGWRGEAGSAMHHPMADAQNLPAADQPGDRLQDCPGGGFVVQPIIGPVPFHHRGARSVDDLQMGFQSDLLQLAMEQAGGEIGGLIDRELDAGGTGVKDGNAAWHGSNFFRQKHRWNFRGAVPIRPNHAMILLPPST